MLGPGLDYPKSQDEPGLRPALLVMEEKTPMETLLIKILEEMQRHAKVCETVANDSNEQALTGESCEKERHAQDAKDWMMKAKVWLEAESVVREMIDPQVRVECASPTTVPPPAPCI